jgi:2-polyprenyl-6-methoxyphenol hydroxylase-like FAD-dependent oxidoreductase
MAGAAALADALAVSTGGPEEVFAPYEARLRPWAGAARRMARRKVQLLTAANRFHPLARHVASRLAARPFLAAVVGRLLNREGERQ